jgi:hypothetical protein
MVETSDELEGAPSRYSTRMVEAAATVSSGDMPDIPEGLRRARPANGGDDPDGYLRLVGAA